MFAALCLVYPVAQWEYLCAGNRKCVECKVSFCTSTAIVRLVEELHVMLVEKWCVLF